MCPSNPFILVTDVLGSMGVCFYHPLGKLVENSPLSIETAPLSQFTLLDKVSKLRSRYAQQTAKMIQKTLNYPTARYFDSLNLSVSVYEPAREFLKAL